jgi:phosphoribosylformylglycinamidine cyclo-ligase
MPGLYVPPDYDLAGFIVGYVEENRVLGPERVRADDVLVALPSAGLHTNGYSLARKVVSERLKLGLSDEFPGANATVGDVLLAEHRSYLPALKPVLDRVHAMAHITGGGLPGNLDRVLPSNLDAVVDTSSWRVPDVFSVLQKGGSVDVSEMHRTFNMGVGMVVICAPTDVNSVVSAAAATGISAWKLGALRPGAGTVILS